MDRKTLEKLQRACHIRLTDEETDAFLRELQEIEDSFPDLTEDRPLSGAAQTPFASFRPDEPDPVPHPDPFAPVRPDGYYPVRGDGHE